MALRVVVPVGDETADRLREKLIPAIESLRVGVSTDPDAHYGPVVSKAHRERIEHYIQMCIDEGGELVIDGRNALDPEFDDAEFQRQWLAKQEEVYLAVQAFVVVLPLRAVGRRNDISYGMYIYAFPVEQMTMALFHHLTPWQLALASFPPTLLPTPRWAPRRLPTLPRRPLPRRPLRRRLPPRRLLPKRLRPRKPRKSPLPSLPLLPRSLLRRRPPRQPLRLLLRRKRR